MGNPVGDTAKKISPWKVVLPAVFGFGIVGYFVYRDFNKIDFSSFSFSYYTILFLMLAFLMMFFRDFGYVVRLRILSSGELSWRKCIRIILLWEFGSAVTPSAVGGTAIATVFIWKEGVNLGKSTSIVMATSFLDELYFSIMFPIVLLIFSKAELFHVVGADHLANRFFVFAIVGYAMKLIWAILMGYSIFINPRFFASLINWIFKWKLLRKWKDGAEKLASNFEVSN
jgi:hypothetical protein